MINDKTVKQEGGENSTNLQGQSIIINQGISYQDAKSIAIDVFKANFLELSTKAADTAKQRAEELVDDFLNQIKERNPDAISSMETPGMQHAIFTAQKEFARTGDKDLSDMLVDILVDRAGLEERNLKQIVLDESLTIVPMLTASQLDTLTVVFIIKYSRNFQVGNIPLLKKYLTEYILPFTSTLSKENSLYQHLEFSRCGSISLSAPKVEDRFSKTYKGIFCKGFTSEQFTSTTGFPLEKYPQLIMPCLHDPTKFQINSIDEEVLEQKAEKLHIEKAELETLKLLMNNYQFSQPEVKEILKGQGDFMNLLFDIWDNSSIKNMTLTSVGIAIAIANLRRKTGITVDLGIWIK